MRVDHLGYAVKNMARAKQNLTELGFLFEEDIEDHDRNVLLCFGENGEYRIELVAPLDKTKESPVDLYLGKTGPAPYHICYQTDDIEGAVDALSKKGFRVVIPETPAVAFGGRPVVFMLSLGAGLLELVEAE